MSIIFSTFLTNICTNESSLVIIFRNSLCCVTTYTYIYQTNYNNKLHIIDFPSFVFRADSVYRLCYSSLIIHWRSYMMSTRNALFKSFLSFDMVTI